MKYITGIFALNIPCKLETAGDWHASCLDWDNAQYKDTETAFFGDYGIEENKIVSHIDETPVAVANHIRACLDMIIDRRFDRLYSAMKDDFICTDIYNDEIFSKVAELKSLPYWQEIYNFMCREYLSLWLQYLQKKQAEVLLMMNKPDARAIKEQLLLEEEVGYSNGLYRYTQIELAYNSNRIEGSTLTRDHTRSLYETNTILADKDVVIRVNDVVEMNNHFQAFRYMLHNAEKPLDEALIKNIHKILLTGTKQAEQDWFNVGEYKKLDNGIGNGVETCPVKEVAAAMKKLIAEYGKTEKTIENIIDFHASFEKIHPFQDGNGRTGRLVMFKECLGNDIVPFIIDEQHKAFYIRGLQYYPEIMRYLVDTCLSAQDKYETMYNKYKFPEKRKQTD